MEKIKVLFLSANNYLSFTGADYYTKKLINIINKNFDAEIDEYSYDMCVNEKFESNNLIKNVKIIYPSKKRNFVDKQLKIVWGLRNLYVMIFKANKQIRKIADNYDLIINNTMILHSDKKIMKKRNYISVQHQDWKFMKMYQYRQLSWLAVFLTRLIGLKNCFKHSFNLMCFTKDDALKIEENYRQKNKVKGGKVYTAPNAVYTSKQMDELWNKRKLVLKSNKYTHDILYVGRVTKLQKRIQKIYKLTKHVDNNFSIVGDGPYLKKIKNKKNIICFNKVPHEKVMDYYINSRCHISVSSFEGFPATVPEATSCGVPSIVTNSCVFLEKIAADLNLPLIDRSAPISKYKNAINDFYKKISDKNFYYNLSYNCYKYAKENLSYELFESSWLKAINEILEQNKR